ncbi:MAG: bifunctional DNA-formamidopyrimidine glycosylase/DNA-(apurinic or apyrimidinic site) lyase [Deltaproteobacteria bacterium]|nr:bifunctional DNA-formamidopyrimidine glycosylase/DNA-(apurinic or apyrimidinic site) lyase [Deltaproteobacteria bacterium]
MPELPEVETVAENLRRHALGRRVEDVWCSRARLRGREVVDPRALRAHAVGRTIERVWRRGKYLVCELSGEGALLFHLGMSGHLHLAAADEPRPPHTHVAFRLGPRRGGHRRRASVEELRFVDPRRFGLCRALPRAALAATPALARLGPEPLEPGFTVAVLAAALRGSRREVKTLLLDQTRVAGVGNIYAAEALFLAGIHPKTPAGRLGAARVARLHLAVREVLGDAIANGGTTLRDFTDPEGRPGAHRVRLRVYDRDGQPCVECGATVRLIVQAQRSTFYCPRCQRR